MYDMAQNEVQSPTLVRTISKLSFWSMSLGFSISIICHLIPNARLWMGMGSGNMLGHTEPIHYCRNIKKKMRRREKKRRAPSDDGLDNR